MRHHETMNRNDLPRLCDRPSKGMEPGFGGAEDLLRSPELAGRPAALGDTRARRKYH